MQGVISKPILKNKVEILTSVAVKVQPQPRKLLDLVRDAIRVKHYSYQTEKTYVQWIRRYILFNGIRHPNEMGGAEINAFLTHLAVDENVAASTQDQALCAILLSQNGSQNYALSVRDFSCYTS